MIVSGLMIACLVRDFRATDETEFVGPTAAFSFSMRNDARFNDPIQFRRNLVELLRIGKVACIEQSRGVAHGVAEEQSGLQDDVRLLRIALERNANAFLVDRHDRAAAAQQRRAVVRLTPTFRPNFSRAVSGLARKADEHRRGIGRLIERRNQPLIPKRLGKFGGIESGFVLRASSRSMRTT